MTNPAPEELIPFLAHKDRLVRSYTARLLGLDNEEQVEQYSKASWSMEWLGGVASLSRPWATWPTTGRYNPWKRL